MIQGESQNGEWKCFSWVEKKSNSFFLRIIDAAFHFLCFPFFSSFNSAEKWNFSSVLGRKKSLPKFFNLYFCSGQCTAMQNKLLGNKNGCFVIFYNRKLIKYSETFYLFRNTLNFITSLNYSEDWRCNFSYDFFSDSRKNQITGADCKTLINKNNSCTAEDFKK